MFGGGKGSSGGKPGGGVRKQDPNAAINKVRETVSKLEKRENKLNRDIEQCEKRAKAFVQKKQKKKALMELKKKKVLEQNLERIMGKKLNLETQIMTLEEAIMNAEVVSGMKVGANALQQQQQKVDIDEVDDLRDQMQEQQDMMHDINDVLAEPVVDLDDDDLLAELNELEELEADDMLADLPVVDTQPAQTNPQTQDLIADMPSVPSVNKPQKVVDKDEEELMAL